MKSELRSLFRFCRNLIDSPAVVLLYHRVTDLPLDPQLLCVSPGNFNDHIKVLKRKYNLIDLQQFADCLINKKKLPKRSVILTFDDGYADNFREALPILESNKAQALFYVSTSNLDTANEFWWDDLERIFLVDRNLPVQLTFTIGDRKYTFSTSSRQDRLNTYDSLHPLIKNCATIQRDELMDRIVAWSGAGKKGRDTHRMLTTDELLSLASSSSSVIGAHTHTHPRLSVCTPTDQRKDIYQSKSILENLLNREVIHFSYPFGSKFDYTPETLAICKEIGFKIVAANYHDQLHSWHSNFELPRMLVRNWTLNEFENKMHTFYNY